MTPPVVRQAQDNLLVVVIEHGDLRFSVRDVGGGHGVHTITQDAEGLPRGRMATEHEVALAEALVSALAASRRDP